MQRRFKIFLESLKREDNTNILEAILEGYTVLTESDDTPNIKKTQSFKTDEGKFSVHDTIKFPRGRNNMFTVKEDKDGWIVRNAILPDELKRKGIATSVYRNLNNESIKKTGKPLRSTQPRTLSGGEVVHELSPDGIALWDSFVEKGYAKKLGEKNYVFTSNLMESIGPVYHGTLPESVENIIFENSEINYTKFPLSALIKQARKFDNFEDFARFYSIEIYHGYYWHLTDNPHFKISEKTGPRDMSSMASGGISEKGALMITSDLTYWDDYYNDDKITRGYAVLLDASDIDPKELTQVSRGFGNEVYLDSIQSKKLKIMNIYDIKSAKQLNKKFNNIIPQSKEQLYKLWKFSNNKNLNESREGGKKLSDYPRYQYSNKVTIFRATPSDIFDTDSYVTLSGKFAIEHAENNHAVNDEQNNVIKAVVHPELVVDASNPGEYFYKGNPIKGEIVYSSKGDNYEGDIPNLMEAIIGPVYHGSGTDIKEFKYEFTNQGADQLGSGFYFTSSLDEASGYTGNRQSSDVEKLGGEDKPTVITAKLNIKKPLNADKIGNINSRQIRRIILKSPDLENGLSNWGDVQYSGRESVLRDAVEGYVIENENILQGLFSLANDFYGDNIEQFNRAVYMVIGYDGVVKHWDNRTHYVAWFPEQIKIIKKSLNESTQPYQSDAHDAIDGFIAEVGNDTYKQLKKKHKRKHGEQRLKYIDRLRRKDSSKNAP